MRLEDATKEELVWWIRNNAFLLSFNEHRFTSDILFRRSEKALEKSRAAGKRYSDALDEYIELLKPYQGRPVSEMPEDTLKKGVGLEREMKAADRERDSANKAWESIHREIDSMLKREGT